MAIERAGLTPEAPTGAGGCRHRDPARRWNRAGRRGAGVDHLCSGQGHRLSAGACADPAM